MPKVNHTTENLYNFGHPEGYQIPALAGIDSLQCLADIVTRAAVEHLIQPPRDNPLP